MQRRHIIRAAATAPWLGLAVARRAAAAGYPERPVRLVVPFAAGGNLDRVARLVAARMQDRLGQSIVVENRAGAGGSVGTLQVAQARPDGYTLLAATNGGLINGPLTQPNIGYDPMRDFALIGLASMSRLAAFVAADLPVRTLQELIALCRARPGQISIGHAGIGSNNHLGLELFTQRTGIQLLPVAYRGGGQAVPDLLAGNIAGLFLEISSVLPLHREGKGRIIAIAAERRSPLLPEVPTFIEQGLPGFLEGAFFGLAAPAGTPPEAISRLGGALAAVLAEPELREQYNGLALEVPTPEQATPAGFTAFLTEETERVRQKLRGANIRLE